MSSSILSQIRTIDERNTLLHEIDLLKASLFEKSPDKFEKILATEVRSAISQAITEEIKKPNVDKKSFLNDLEKEAQNLKVFKLTIAIEPKESTIARLCEWARINISKDILLDIETEPSILGGAIISHGGKYLDFSLKTALSQKLAQDKKEIIKTLKSKSQ